MPPPLRAGEVFGLLRPAVDAHTLGISSVEQLLTECGFRVVVAGAAICEAANYPGRPDSISQLEGWIRSEGITRLGFSYRLDPDEGGRTFGELVHHLGERRLLAERGGPIAGLYFAGLPTACDRVQREHGQRVEVFSGDETPVETLRRLGVPAQRLPQEIGEQVDYDDMRVAFARELLRREKHLAVRPVDRSGYPGFGNADDRLVDRVRHGVAGSLPPLMRAHVGPYLPDRIEAVRLFCDWTRQLAQSGLLDVLSIGTSQLSQSSFGEDWADRRNGGGVPINSELEFRAVWQVARPMLVRTYAGTKNIPELARLYERALHIAWHALSLWWFSQIDERGPLPVRANLEEHLATLRCIAESGKPFEPNIPHHFAFRGADDVTYVVSAVLAARAARAVGVRHLILQTMLNTPRSTWGVQDLAKCRALLQLVRELEDGRFRVILQPRAGLDCFSADPDRAKEQLAAVSALMDDIEPHDPHSPPIVHVVSYSEGSHLADPPVVNESIQITRAAIEDYRRQRARGDIEDMARHPQVQRREEELLAGARAVLAAIEASVPAPYTPAGLYVIFAAGFLPVPYLWACREEFSHATRWRTRVVRGSVQVVDEEGGLITPGERAGAAAEIARSMQC